MLAPPDCDVPFSLFEDDRLDRFYAWCGAGRFDRFGLAKRCAAAAFFTYVPLMVLAWREGLYPGGALYHDNPANDFFADFAAWVQLVISLPLFLICEPIMNSRTRGVVEQLLRCDIIRPEDRPRLCEMNAQVERARQSWWPDLACLAMAYTLSLVILVPELTSPFLDSWHTRDYDTFRSMTATGAWAFLVSLPMLNFTWLRFVWKVCLWSYYLFRLTRMRLQLHPTHPDLVGGIGFISDAQGQFALFLLAYGLSNIAAPVGYQIAILGYKIETMTVWGPMLGFAIGGPLVFSLPLLMFTHQLYREKEHALAIYRKRVTESSRRMESHWQSGGADRQVPEEEVRELAELNTLSAMFSHIEKMRVVPFDLKSFAQLLGSSFSSIAAVMPLVHYNGEAKDVLELLDKLMHLGGG